MAAENHPASGDVSLSFATVSECQDCLRLLSLPLPTAAAYHPESISFHWEHGLDILGSGVWEFNRYLHDSRWSSERIGTDPDEYRVEFRHDTSSRLGVPHVVRGANERSVRSIHDGIRTAHESPDPTALSRLGSSALASPA